jgi:acyl carrier protein
MDEARQIRNFILKNFLFSEDDGSLLDDASLIASGTIDSTGVLELIMFIERPSR